MTTAIRSQLENWNGAAAAHAGLLLTRYLRDAVDGTEAAQKAKDELFKSAEKALAKGKDLYQLAFNRWERSLPTGARAERFRTPPNGRIILGLGGHHVIETGLTLHHMYGVPYIPGTALKGLAAHYCHRIWGATQNSGATHEAKSYQLGGDYFRVLFGNSNEGGLIEFHDAWITPDTVTTCLCADVMTPHHGNYYMTDNDLVPPPSDFDDPVPVPFLSVQGTFLVAISKRDIRPDALFLTAAFELIHQSLKMWGIGGKTATGYGRLDLFSDDRTP